MRCGLVARKLGMSRIFSDDGEHIPVTVLRIEDVEVLAIKSIDNDGYTAVQLGFANKKPKILPNAYSLSFVYRHFILSKNDTTGE